MDAATSAIGKIFKGEDGTKAQKVEADAHTSQGSTASTVTSDDKTVAPTDKETTVEQEVVPAVEHETIKKEHETKEQKVIDRERHQHHYHTTIQPLKDQEIQDTKHDAEVAPTQYKEVNKDAGKEDNVEARHNAEVAGLKDTTEREATRETKTNEGTIVDEHVHHHLHETIQPVIEKETIVPEVTHKKIPIKEVIKEGTQDHGVTKKEPISVDEFAHKLDGESKVKVSHDGAHTVSNATGVVPKDA